MIRLFSIWLLFASLTFGQHQKVNAPINAQGRQLTFHLYHFSNNQHTLQFAQASSTLEDSINQHRCKAAVVLGQTTANSTQHLLARDGNLSLATTAQPGSHPLGTQLLQNNHAPQQLNNSAYARRTFLLSDGKGNWAIGYAPALTQLQLATALVHISVNHAIDYQHAFLLNSGNQSAIWVRNSNNHPFYLKEIEAPAAALVIQ